MDLFAQLRDRAFWADFREYKKEHGQLSRGELASLDTFLEAQDYIPAAEGLEALAAGDAAAFPLPEKLILSKQGSRKKRTVYCYPERENWLLKGLTYLLQRYDGALSPACYSFRRTLTAADAVRSILRLPDLPGKFVLKEDIHDYFNSMPVEPLIRSLERIITDDPLLLAALSALLRQGACLYKGERTEEERGAMAGVPISAFLADVYLQELDESFTSEGIPYYRYSDDILIFADTEEERDASRVQLEQGILERGLTVNESKLALSGPGEAWEFLGFRYFDGKLDLSAATVMKIKAKIRRKARALYRWRIKKKRDWKTAARAMIRCFDRKFYDITGDRDFTWSRWFFPLLGSTEGLKEIDDCMVQYLRYLRTGRHSTANYEVEYQDLRALGYTGLVHEYYSWRDECRKLEKAYRESLRAGEVPGI